MNSTGGAAPGRLSDDPIYKPKQMHTVTAMLKRILTLLAGASLGILLSLMAFQVAAVWGFWPNRELNRSADYVRNVLELVNENYVEASEAEYDRLARKAIQGVIESLDPHSEFMAADAFGQLEDDLDGDFCGIGVQVELRNDKIMVIAPIAGSPGERAGILRGDEIVSVDGRIINAKSPMDDAISRLRGKPHTSVKVGIHRPTSDKNIELTLVREVIKVESVRVVQLFDGHIGYIQLVDFSARTGEQFSAALQSLLDQNADALILDLRNNPGGLLEAAVEVAEVFFPKGELVVYTQGRKQDDREDFVSELSSRPIRIPMAVIINSGTASAAEIVTGALKDTNRAVVVGERSFGKGSVQTIYKLRNGEGMRITTARYYTPSGLSIHGKGIAPNVEIIMLPEEDNKLRLQRVRNDVINQNEFKERFGFTPIVDRQLEAAIDILKKVSMLNSRVGSVGKPTP
jgi:carboxyl-terminal processing protease